MNNKLKNLKAVIFDMDGVIVDSESHWDSVEKNFLESVIPTWSDEDHAKILGLSVYNLYNFLRAEYSISYNQQEFLDLYNNLAENIYREQCNINDGLFELLTLIKLNKLKIALASSSPLSWINIVLDRFKLKEYFTVVVSSDHVNKIGKPKPDIYLKALELLNLNALEVLAIEDSNNGIESAIRAGIFCVGYRNNHNHNQDLKKSNQIINHLSQIKIN